MATAPQFYGPDGVVRTRYVFTTDVAFRFFTGTMDADTADMLVSIRGGDFESDPDYILFEGTSFTIPNPAAFPEGLQLLPGSNTIEVQSVLTNGQATSISTIEANLALDRNVKAGVIAPSGVTIEKLDRTVKIAVAGLDDENVTGYNFYASAFPGGGATGYKKINLDPVSAGVDTESSTSLGDLTVDAAILMDGGSPAANPLFMRVVGTQVDKSNNLLQSDFDQVILVPDTTTHLRTEMTVYSVATTQNFSFIHDRAATATSTPATIPYAEFSAVADTDPLYYAVSAIYFIDGVEYESSLSQEVAGVPIIVTPTIASLPTVSRQQIVRDTSLAIFRSRPDVDIKAGSVTKDVFIDPFSTEAERIRFVIGFIQAAQSFTTLLDIDDPTGSGTSIPVSQSPYKIALKQAFFLRDDTSVQNLIDNAFDHLASRRGITRLTGQRARGEVTLYMTTRPPSTVPISIGTGISGGGVTTHTTSAAIISTSGAGTYNPSTGRWSTTAFVQADDVGVSGNVAPGALTSVQNGPSGVQAVNNSALFGGEDTETNRELAVRADGALASVDSGTYRGLTQAAGNVAGVRQVNVVEAGHPMMMRDIDPETGVHWGGKVDVWCRGENLATLTDTFAFRFETKIDGQFEPVGDIQSLRFRAVDASEANPLIEMLDIPTWGFEFKAIDGTGVPRPLSLTDVTVIAPDTIQLSTAANDPTSLSLTDQFRGTFRYRTSDHHVFASQPVSEVISFSRDVNGTKQVVAAAAYRLVHTSDPLVLGNSTEAGDYLQVVQPEGEQPLNIPSGDPIAVSSESHVMLSGPEYLDNLGINKYTVSIWSLDRSIEYTGPFAPSGTDLDYTFINEDNEHPVAIVLTDESRITVGQTVLVDYEHDENYSVEYTSNALVNVAQNAIDNMRHATADVLVKEAVQVPVNISGTVVLKPRQDSGVMIGEIRTSLARLFGALSLGEPVRQADIINTIDSVDGVSYVVVPLVLLGRQDGAMVVREPVITTETANWQRIADWSTAGVNVYLLNDALLSGTLDGGGNDASGVQNFRGVFFNDLPMTLIEGVPLADGAPLRGVPYSAAIIGNLGAAVPGVALADTKRRVVLALPSTGVDGKSITPSSGEVAVTYIVADDTGTKPGGIEPGPTEYLVLGDLDFTFDTDENLVSVVTGGRF